MACASRPEVVAYFAPFVDEGTLFVPVRLSAFESGSEAVFHELLQLRPDKTEADVDCAPPCPPAKPDPAKATARELEDLLDAWQTFRRAAAHLLASRLRSWKAASHWLLVARRVSPPGLWLGLVPLAALAIGTVGWVRHQTAAPPAPKATVTEATVTPRPGGNPLRVALEARLPPRSVRKRGGGTK